MSGASKGFLSVVLFSLFSLPAFADTVYFKSGNTLKGLVVEEHQDRIILSTEEGEKTVLRREIDDVFYSEPERNHLYLGNQALEEGELGLARGFFDKALQINPRFEEAHDALRRAEDLERKRDTPLPPGQVAAALWEQWGLALESVSSQVRVAQVRPDSSAERAGLERGDVLIALWGESLAFLNPDQAAERLWGPPGTVVKITVQRVVRLAPPAAASAREWPHWRLEMERLGLTVDRVEPAGAASLSGLFPGDRIIGLNGQPTRYLKLSDARRLAQTSTETGLTLLIQRDRTVERE